MFEISKIRKHAEDLVRESSKTKADFDKIRTDLNELADEILKVSLNLQTKMDLYQFKSFCGGLNKCLPELELLKGEKFKEIAENAKKVLILTKTFERDPQEAYKEWGEISTIKAGLVANLGRLRTALKNEAVRERLVAGGR